MKTNKHQANRRSRSAFTLIEIMVATVVMVVLVGLVIQITSEVLKVWNRSSGKLSANAQARIAMELITQDLETAVFRNNGLRWLEAVQEPLGDPFSGDTSFKTTELRLFSPALDRPAGPGDISAVSYILRYSDPISGSLSDTSEDRTDNRTFILYRNVVSPQLTFDELLGEGNQEEFSDALWSESATIAGGDNFLVSNIVDFRIDFYLADPDGTRVAGNTFFGGNAATAGNSAPDPGDRFPLSYADVTLKIISDEALRAVQNNAIGQAGFRSNEEFINANAEVYSRRVNFLVRPL